MIKYWDHSLLIIETLRTKTSRMPRLTDFDRLYVVFASIWKSPKWLTVLRQFFLPLLLLLKKSCETREIGNDQNKTMYGWQNKLCTDEESSTTWFQDNSLNYSLHVISDPYRSKCVESKLETWKKISLFSTCFVLFFTCFFKSGRCILIGKNVPWMKIGCRICVYLSTKCSLKLDLFWIIAKKTTIRYSSSSSQINLFQIFSLQRNLILSTIYRTAKETDAFSWVVIEC